MREKNREIFAPQNLNTYKVLSALLYTQACQIRSNKYFVKTK